MLKNKRYVSPENALYRLAALCSQGEQCEFDMRTKLRNWNIGESDADKIIDRLIDEKYIDETRYANAYCRDKFRFSGWGRIKIGYSLKQKRIDRNVISAALDAIDQDEYITMLRNILKSKMRLLEAREPIKAKASLIRFAASRGFESDLIFSILPEIINADDDEIE